MRRSISTTALAVLCWLGAPAAADEVDDAIRVFIEEDGYERRDPLELDARLLELFGQAGAMRPDGAASGLEKALLLVDAVEPPLPRVRYMVRYGQMMQEETPVSFVLVERYNLGPVIREMVAQDYGEENTADPQEFGVGPHVEWRIVTMPLMGQTAALLEASRREVDDKEAASVDCGGRGCLSLDMLDDAHEWRDIEPAVNIASAYEAVSENELAVPARAAAELAVAAGLAEGDGGEPFWSGPEQPEAAHRAAPFLFVAIDRNLGQEYSIDAAIGQTLLNDDAVEELWLRRVEMPGAVFWMQAAVERGR